MQRSFRTELSSVAVARDSDVIRVRDPDDARRVATALLEQVGPSGVAGLLSTSTAATEPADTVEALTAQLLGGALVLLKQHERRTLDPPRSTSLSDLVGPGAPSSHLRTTWFAVRVVDRVGAPLSGVEVLFDHPKGRVSASTDSSGLARVDDVPWSSASVTVAQDEALQAAIDESWSKPNTDPSLVREAGLDVVYYRDAEVGPVPLRAAVEHTVSVQPFVVHSQMLGMLFETDRDFLLPVAVGALAELRALYERCTPCRLLVVGHTDTSGQAAHNDALSLRRAETVRAFVTDDVDTWLRRYEDDVPESERWGHDEDQQMLAALPDAAQRSPEEPPLAWFRRTRSLAEDQTQVRRALITESFAHDGTSLPPGVEVDVHGCGEHFPLDSLGVDIEDAPVDGDDDPLDRRVELFFFGDARGVQPPLPGPIAATGSLAYPTWRARSHETYAHVFGAQSLEIILQDDSGAPIPNARYTVVLAVGSRIEGELDGDGFARLSRLPPGTIHVDFPDLAQGFTVESTTSL